MTSTKPIKIYFFGDSICFGQYVSPHKSWVSQVSEKLTEYASKYNRDIIVQNPSINGNTTRQALERMPYDVQSHEPDMVIVQFGMNDCNYWETDRGLPRVSPDAFGANLKEIVKRSFIFGARHVFLNTNHPSCCDTQRMPFAAITYQQSNAYYNTIIRQAALECSGNVTLIDIEKEFTIHAP